MVKKFSFIITVILISGIAFSNPQIASKHKDLSKDGKKVNCLYCHTDAKIEKKKGQLKDKVLNGVPLSKKKTCAGTACHK